VTVIDASVLVRAAADVGAAGRSARALVSSGSAPDVVFVESYSALRRQFLRDELTDDAFRFGLRFLDAVPLRIRDSRGLLPRMAELVHSVSAFDATYVALAEVLDVPLVTTDARLARAHGLRCEVRLLA
jgi:predicted nucleic acid-binding protein